MPDRPTITPPKTIPDREELTLAELIGIKGATGIDPLNPGSIAEGYAAMLWFALRREGQTVEVADLLELPKSTVDKWIDDADERAAEEAAADPTHGSGTPGNAYPSLSGSDSPPETSEPAHSGSSTSSEPPTSTSKP